MSVLVAVKDQRKIKQSGTIKCLVCGYHTVSGYVVIIIKILVLIIINPGVQQIKKKVNLNSYPFLKN